MRSQEFITELKSSSEVTELESQLDKMFSTLGLDVAFTRHFIERLLGREKHVTIDEIRAAFEKLKKKYKGKLLKAKKQDMGPGALQDFDSDLNVLFAIQPDKANNEYDLVNITVKQKDPDEFHTSTPSGNATPYQVGSRKTNETFSDSRLRNFPGADRDRPVSGSEWVKGDLIKITPKGVKVRGSMQFLNVGDWVEIKETGYQQKIIHLSKHSVRLEDGKYYSLKQLRYPMD